MWSYRAHGLRIDSEVELHGLISDDAGPADLSIVLGAPCPIEAAVPDGRLILESGAGGPAWVAIAENDKGWVVRYPGFAEFLLSHDRATLTAVRPPDRPGDEWIALLAIGNPLALVVTLLRDLALHASAVHVRDRAIAFVGPSGTGKSTTACSLATVVGASIISDDLLRVGSQLHPVCFRGAVDMRLRSGPTTDAVAGTAARRPTVDRRVAVGHQPIAADEVALDAIVLPRPNRGVTRPSVERLPVSDALFGLLAETRLVGWQEPVMQRQQFEGVADLVERVPVMRAEIPWAVFGPECLEELVDSIVGALEQASVR